MDEFRKPMFELTYGVKVPPEMAAKIHEIIEDYCRKQLPKIVQKILDDKLDEIVCNRLKERKIEGKVVRLKKLPLKRATSLVQTYIDQHQGCRTSDIICDLALDPDLVLGILKTLEKGRMIRGKEIESKRV
jgi:hypothetical protein